MQKDLLVYTDEDKIAMLKEFDRNTDSIKQDIEAIKNWVQKQPHLSAPPCKCKIGNITNLFV